MKCWKCGSHMTKYGNTATCDNCGRTAYRKTRSYSNSSDDDFSISSLLGVLGIAGLASYAARKLDSNDDYSSSVRSDRESVSFSERFTRFMRNTFYTLFAFLFLGAGSSLAIFSIGTQLGEAVPFYLAIFAGVMLIWGGILVFITKGRNGYTFKNIVGSVIANIVCKIAGLFALFADISLLTNLSFVFRAIIGILLFVAGHYLYKEIKDS